MFHAIEEASRRTSRGSYWIIEAFYLQQNDLNDFGNLPVDLPPLTIADFNEVWLIPTGSMPTSTDMSKGMALNMFKLYSESIETAQANNPVSMIAPTNFSEEDLFSNLLGFWAALEGKSGSQARQAIRGICNSFVLNNTDQAGIDASLWVYDNVYGGEPWIYKVKGGQVCLPPLVKQTLWQTGWRKWEPRLVPLPQVNFSAPYSLRINQCAINNNARCMPAQIQSLLALEQRSPQKVWPWGQGNKSYEVNQSWLIWQQDNVNLYETPW